MLNLVSSNFTFLGAHGRSQLKSGIHAKIRKSPEITRTKFGNKCVNHEHVLDFVNNLYICSEDIILLPSSGRTGSSRRFLNSITEYVTYIYSILLLHFLKLAKENCELTFSNMFIHSNQSHPSWTMSGPNKKLHTF